MVRCFLAFVQFGVRVTMVTTLPYITEELGVTYAEYGYFMAGFPIGYIVGAILRTNSLVISLCTYERRLTRSLFNFTSID